MSECNERIEGSPWLVLFENGDNYFPGDPSAALCSAQGDKESNNMDDSNC